MPITLLGLTVAKPITLELTMHSRAYLPSRKTDVNTKRSCIHCESKKLQGTRPIISASLSINIASVSADGVDLSPSPSVGRSVCLCPESVLWQNGWLDPDAAWDGEWGRSRDGCIRLGWWSSKGRGSFGINLGRPIVTNGNLLPSCARATRSSQITLGGLVLLGSHTYSVRVFCFGRPVCRLSVPRQISKTKRERREI